MNKQGLTSMKNQLFLEHVNDISESIESLSDQIYRILQDCHTDIDNRYTLDHLEDAMGQLLAIQLLAQDLDSSVSDEMMQV